MSNSNTTCDHCKKPIYKKPSDLLRFKTKYCSNACYRAITSIPIKTCKSCKKEFKANFRNQTFCSHSCSNAGRKGRKYLGSRLDNNSKRKFSVLKEAFNFETCMIEECNYGTTFDLHRLVPGREGGEYVVGNMFAICPNHHAEITRKIIEVEKVSDSKLRII